MSTSQGTSPTPQIHTLLYQYWYIFPFAFLLSYIVYQRFFSPLARIPGPFLASLNRWWLVWASRTGNYHRIAIALHEKYGPVVRVAPNQLSFSRPQVTRQIYPVNNASAYPKSDWYRVFRGPRKMDLFAGQDVREHAQQRKLVARAYTMETLKDLEQYVDHCLEILVQQFDKRVGQRLDMSHWVHLFAADVIGEITWSTNFGYMAAGKDSGMFAAVRTVGRSAFWLGHVPFVYDLHEMLIKPLFGNQLGVNSRHGALRDFALKETARRRENPGGKKDLISKFFETHEKQPDTFTFTDVISMGTTQVGAGSDTVAATLRAIIYYLLKTPSSKEKLVAEIDEARRNGKLSNPARYEEAQQMKYVQAVINEGLRIQPAVGMHLPRVVPPEGATIEGYYIPGGSIVGINAFVSNRDKEVFGEDADGFRPDRWLEGDTSDMNRYNLAFGAGSRACVGRNIALQEMAKFVPTLFLNYDMELADPNKPWREECMFLIAQFDMDVILMRRQDPLAQA